MPVEAHFEAFDEELTLPVFHPVEPQAEAPRQPAETGSR